MTEPTESDNGKQSGEGVSTEPKTEHEYSEWYRDQLSKPWFQRSIDFRVGCDWSEYKDWRKP